MTELRRMKRRCGGRGDREIALAIWAKHKRKCPFCRNIVLPDASYGRLMAAEAADGSFGANRHA